MQGIFLLLIKLSKINKSAVAKSFRYFATAAYESFIIC